METDLERIPTTTDEAIALAVNYMGKSFKEIDKHGHIQALKGQIGKGHLGNIVQSSIFNVPVNSVPEADIVGVAELKLIPFKFLRNGEIRSKERIVCNIIPYMTENLTDFKKSSFYLKNQTILFLTYHHDAKALGKPSGDTVFDKTDFTLAGYYLLDLKKETEVVKQIEKDWNVIAGKIADGKAHTISERDTLYLGACTKGMTRDSSYRTQPHSTTPAKQRAYSLKCGTLAKHIIENQVMV